MWVLGLAKKPLIILAAAGLLSYVSKTVQVATLNKSCTQKQKQTRTSHERRKLQKGGASETPHRSGALEQPQLPGNEDSGMKRRLGMGKEPRTNKETLKTGFEHRRPSTSLFLFGKQIIKRRWWPNWVAGSVKGEKGVMKADRKVLYVHSPWGSSFLSPESGGLQGSHQPQKTANVCVPGQGEVWWQNLVVMSANLI